MFQNIVVKDVLLQPDTQGKRGRWIAKNLEFDIEIKPTKLIKGQGLARLMAKSNHKVLELSMDGSDAKVIECPNVFQSEWYCDLVHFLQTMNCPPDMDRSKKRAFKLKVVKYCIIENNLYWKDPTRILLRCVNEEEAQRIMTEMHASACGGHIYWNLQQIKL